MIHIIDASVALKWFLSEDRSADARRLLDDPSMLDAPKLIILEVAHVLWKSHRRGQIAETEVSAANQVMTSLFAHGADIDPLIAPAVRLMHHVQLAVFDCLYLALAERADATLVTADEGQFAAARRARIKARLL